MADNPDELFDVVDELDRVVGQARRADVHAGGLRHRAVHVLVQRRDGAVYLQKRSMAKDSNPGRWDSSASGHLDSGETYDEAAVRELDEELGVRVPEITRIGFLEASEETGQEFVHIYTAGHEGPFTLHPEEISDGRWVRPERIGEWLREHPEDFPPCFHAVWAVASKRFS